MTDVEGDPERKLSGQEKLAEFLDGEALGSIKYSALVDCAAFMRLGGIMYEDEWVHKRATDPHVIASHAAVQETIRKRRFGEHGREYAQHFEEASIIVDSYFGVEYLEKLGRPYVLNEGWYQGATAVLNVVEYNEGLRVGINV